ncbi:hypothetical protein [Cohnella laeviribosi]|uniref:hypothetical protein n=1 Tax=Cohnella laeviribosi TaxID=380174 RepID=UPI003D1B98C9
MSDPSRRFPNMPARTVLFKAVALLICPYRFPAGKQHSRFVRTVFRRLWHMHPFVSAVCATATPFLGREGDRSAPKATGLRMSAEFRWNDRLSAEKQLHWRQSGGRALELLLGQLENGFDRKKSKSGSA